MEYEDFEMIVSTGRLKRYLAACSHHQGRTIALYRANLRLSGKTLLVISMVEIALRNAIDRHYLGIYGDDWLVSQSIPGGYLSLPGCERSRATAQKAINELGDRYAHDKALAELNFGFWRYAFGLKEFAAAGSTLLQIFPNRPRGISQREVFIRLGEIHDLRNRIVHHDPICFGGANKSTAKVETAYRYATEFIEWFGMNKVTVLQDLDFVQEEIECIARI